MKKLRLLLLLYLQMSAAVSVIYWASVDWWAYVGEKPKFEMPLWWQIGESAVVGFIVAMLTIFMIFVIGILFGRRGCGSW